MKITKLRSVMRCELWHVDLDQPQEDAFPETLSVAERQRAARFVFERDRHRFVAAHAAMRNILATHTGKAAAELTIETALYGKPWLPTAGAPHFNLSHSGSTGFIGCSTDSAIGVDVEQVHEGSFSELLMAEHFGPAERLQLQRLPPSLRGQAFLHGWTRKEACLKAAGFGLGIIDASLVDIGVTGDARRIELHGDGRRLQVEVRSFSPDDEHICAVARVLTDTAVMSQGYIANFIA